MYREGVLGHVVREPVGVAVEATASGDVGAPELELEDGVALLRELGAEGVHLDELRECQRHAVEMALGAGDARIRRPLLPARWREQCIGLPLENGASRRDLD